MLITRLDILDKVFGGHADSFLRIEVAAGAPSHNAKHIGVIYKNSTNGDFYIATTTSGTWVKINA